jgi:hypothetical protein
MFLHRGKINSFKKIYAEKVYDLLQPDQDITEDME